LFIKGQESFLRLLQFQTSLILMSSVTGVGVKFLP